MAETARPSLNETLPPVDGGGELGVPHGTAEAGGMDAIYPQGVEPGETAEALQPRDFDEDEQEELDAERSRGALGAAEREATALRAAAGRRAAAQARSRGGVKRTVDDAGDGADGPDGYFIRPPPVKRARYTASDNPYAITRTNPVPTWIENNVREATKVAQASRTQIQNMKRELSLLRTALGHFAEGKRPIWSTVTPPPPPTRHEKHSSTLAPTRPAPRPTDTTLASVARALTAVLPLLAVAGINFARAYMARVAAARVEGDVPPVENNVAVDSLVRPTGAAQVSEHFLR